MLVSILSGAESVTNLCKYEVLRYILVLCVHKGRDCREVFILLVMINPCGLSLVTEVPPYCVLESIEQGADTSAPCPRAHVTVHEIQKRPQGHWTTGRHGLTRTGYGRAHLQSPRVAQGEGEGIYVIAGCCLSLLSVSLSSSRGLVSLAELILSIRLYVYRFIDVLFTYLKIHSLRVHDLIILINV